jgi:hypothetical protein
MSRRGLKPALLTAASLALIAVGFVAFSACFVSNPVARERPPPKQTEPPAANPGSGK